MPDPAPRRLAYATPTPLRGDRLIVRGNVTGSVALAFGGVAVLAGTAVFSALPMGTCLLVVVGVLLVVFGIGRAITRPPELVMDDRALVSTRGARFEIAWSAVRDVSVVRSWWFRYLVLKVSPSAAAELVTTDYQRPANVADDELLIPLGGLELPPDRVLLEVSTRITRAHVRPVIPIDEP